MRFYCEKKSTDIILDICLSNSEEQIQEFKGKWSIPADEDNTKPLKYAFEFEETAYKEEHFKNY